MYSYIDIFINIAKDLESKPETALSNLFEIIDTNGIFIKDISSENPVAKCIKDCITNINYHYYYSEFTKNDICNAIIKAHRTVVYKSLISSFNQMLKAFKTIKEAN